MTMFDMDFNKYLHETDEKKAKQLNRKNIIIIVREREQNIFFPFGQLLFKSI